MSTYLQDRVPLCGLLQNLKALESQYTTGTEEHTKAWVGWKEKQLNGKDKHVDGPLSLLWKKTLDSLAQVS
jgi:hypothetical protein